MSAINALRALGGEEVPHPGWCDFPFVCFCHLSRILILRIVPDVNWSSVISAQEPEMLPPALVQSWWAAAA